MDALIIIDMQTALLEDDPYNKEGVVKNIQDLIQACRINKVPVIYIRHNDGKGSELESGTDGWQIYEPIAPMPGEKIFDKNFNSAFKKTGLKEYLEERHIKSIILCGMQTEYCFDVTCKVAFEYDFDVTIAKSTVTTFDTSIGTAKYLNEYFEEKIWSNRYAHVVSCEEVLLQIEGTTK